MRKGLRGQLRLYRFQGQAERTSGNSFGLFAEESQVHAVMLEDLSGVGAE